MPRWIVYVLVVLAAAALIPFACIAKARGSKSPVPRIHPIQDMDDQPKFKAQQPNALFADGRAMRPPVPGTVARGERVGDDRYGLGVDGDAWVVEIPVRVDAALLDRGRKRYEIFCAPCHGLSGYGDGMVSRRADALQEGTWVPPSSFHTDLVRSRPVGHLYNTIANGIRNMPAYGSAVPTHDRWAIVAYIRALQLSQHATLDDVPEDRRADLAAAQDSREGDRP